MRLNKINGLPGIFLITGIILAYPKILNGQINPGSFQVCSHHNIAFYFHINMFL